MSLSTDHPFRRLSIGVVSFLAITVMTVGAARAEPPEQADIEGAIHQYLLEHPEVIIEAVEILREREQAGKVAGAREQIELQRETLINDPTSPIGGNPDGDVTLVEFFDYHCGYCKRVLGDMLVLLDDDPNVRVVFKEFPILGPQSVTAARIALAANRQDPAKYMDFHVALMASRARLNEDRAFQMAREMGFDVDGLKADMNSDEISRIIQDNIELARALGINGTPSFIIGDQLVPGAVSLDTLKELIARARRQLTHSPIDRNRSVYFSPRQFWWDKRGAADRSATLDPIRLACAAIERRSSLRKSKMTAQMISAACRAR